MKNAIFGFLLTLCLPASAYASAPFSEPLQPDEAFSLSLGHGAGTSLVADWTIAEGYYLYRDSLRARFADGTPVQMETLAGTMEDDPNFGPSEVYYNRTSATIAGTSGGQIEITYQGCQVNGICYAPERRLIDPVTLAMSNPSAQPATGVNWSTPASPAAGGFELAPEENLVESLLGRSGVTATLGMFLIFGVLLAFTPCVFPMYPIVASALAREGEALTPGRGFMLTAAYVLGLATAFALVGAAAGWSGQNLQMYLQSTWMTGFIAAVFVALALSMFGLFELQLPSSMTSWIASRTAKGGGSLGAASALGFSSALIVGPCVTAPLAGALLYIARTGDTVLGAAALFALGLGKGVPLLVMGTIGGRLLPRAGAWMEKVKSGFAVVFLGTAIWLATPLMPSSLDLVLYAVLLFGVASFLFWSEFRTSRLHVLARTLASMAFIWGAALAIGAAAGSTDPFKPLAALANSGGAPSATSELRFATINSAEQLQSQLAATERPSLVYFTADWCVTCRSIERSVFSDNGVQLALGNMQLLKVDVTDFDGERAQLMKTLRVAGPPTMLFFDAGARELTGTRLTGNVKIADMMQSTNRARGL